MQVLINVSKFFFILRFFIIHFFLTIYLNLLIFLLVLAFFNKRIAIKIFINLRLIISHFRVIKILLWVKLIFNWLLHIIKILYKWHLKIIFLNLKRLYFLTGWRKLLINIADWKLIHWRKVRPICFIKLQLFFFCILNL